MVDLVTFGEGLLRLSPPPGVRIETATQLETRVGGAECNVAIAAARLGCSVAWLSKLPDTPPADRVLSTLRRHDVEPLVTRSESGRQGLYYLERGPEPRGSRVVYDRSAAAVTTADPGELDLSAVERASLCFTSGITPALSETLAETTRHLLETAERVAFDLNYRRKLWEPAAARETLETLLPAVDVLFAPRRDARRVLGYEDDAESIARALHDEYDLETAVVTMSAEGALAWTGAELVEQPVVEAETLDPIGTGDAFVGGYLAQHLDGETVERALRYGAAAAALKRTIAGDVAVISPDEVEAVLDAEEAGIDR